MASPRVFFDPFSYDQGTFYEHHFPKRPLVTSRTVRAAPYKQRDASESIAPLPVKGQGTVAVKTPVTFLLQITIWSPSGDKELCCRVGLTEIQVFVKDKDGKTTNIEYETLKTERDCYLNSGKETTYWLSLDKAHKLLRYGKHFTNTSMTLLEASLGGKASLKGNTSLEGKASLGWKNGFDWLPSVTDVHVAVDSVAVQKSAVIIHPLPVTIDLSPFIAPRDRITLIQLENGEYTVPANLPEACRILYGNVAGVNITLDDEEFPNFTRAIGYSCEEADGWCYKKLCEKAAGGELKMTYLRITIGYNLGNSPGVPYVLEIWPKDHKSVIHDHGKACAIIKVLHGEVVCAYYDSLSSNPFKIGEAHLQKGAVTWLSPQNYQIHQLHNKSGSICCTIQCYRYENEDNVHYDKFDYLDQDNKCRQFQPSSDMAFREFREKMIEEWKIYKDKYEP